MTGWLTTRDPFCKHKHKSPVLCRVPRAASETSLGSASTSWRVRAVNGAMSCKTAQFHRRLALFRLLKPQHYIGQAESENSAE